MAVSENVTITVTAKGTVTVRKEFDEIGNSAKRASSGVDFMRDALRGLVAYMSVTTFVQYADAATRVGNSLKLAGLEGENYLSIQKQLYDAAIKNGQVTEDLANVYQGITAAQETLGYSAQETMDVTRGIAAAMRASTAGTSAQSGALQQLSQLMGGTKVQAQEFNSLIDGARPLLMAAAAGSDRWKGSLSALRNDVKDSNVTVKEFMEALKKGLPEIEAMAGRLPLTIGQAFVSLSQSFQQWMATSYEVSTSASMISIAIQQIGANINVVMPVVIAFGAVMVASFGISLMQSAYQNFMLLGEALNIFAQRLKIVIGVLITYTAAMVRAAAVNMYQGWISAMNTARVTLAALAVSLAATSTAMTTTFIPAIVRAAQSFIASFIPSVLNAGRALVTSLIPQLIAAGRAMLTSFVASVIRSSQALTASFIPAIVAAARALLVSLVASISRTATTMTVALIPAIIRTAQTIATQLVVAITAAATAFARLALALIANPFTIAIAGAAALAYAMAGVRYGFDEADKKIAEFVASAKEKVGELISEINKASEALTNLGGASPDIKIPDLSKAIADGGKDAATSIKSAMNQATTTSAKTTLSTAEQASQIGQATLANSFGDGSKTLGTAVKSGGEEGGGIMAAKIAAQAQVMAAKFEGTGRNIYDLWNNWGNKFINSFGVTIGDLLVKFQQAQTEALKAQADMNRAQADLLREQASVLHRTGMMPGTPGQGGGSGGATSNTSTSGMGGFGKNTGGPAGGGGSSTGSTSGASTSGPAGGSNRTRYNLSRDNGNAGVIRGGTMPNGVPTIGGGRNGRGRYPENNTPRVLNVWDQRGVIDAIGTKAGKDALINHVRANRSEIADALGIA